MEVEIKIPPRDTNNERINTVLAFLFSSKIYFFCNTKLITIPTSEEMILTISTGMVVIFDNSANNPISTKVATPEEAANLVFIRINFLISSLFINTLFLDYAAKLMKLFKNIIKWFKNIRITIF